MKRTAERKRRKGTFESCSQNAAQGVTIEGVPETDFPRRRRRGLIEAQIAAVQSLLDQANATPEKISNVNTGPLNAVDQRILTTSGTREDPTKDVARNTENQFRVAQQSQAILAEMKLLLSQLTNKDNLLVRVVQ